MHRFIIIFTLLCSICYSCQDNNEVLERYPNGNVKILKSFLLNDSLDFKVETFYPNGNLEIKSFYKNNSLHGPIDIYHANGNIAEKGEYVYGKKLGYWTFFTETGRPRKIIEYIDLRDEEQGRVNQVFSIGENGDTLINGESFYYEFYRVKDTIKLGEEGYEFKIVLKGPLFPEAKLIICDFDEKFNLLDNGLCGELKFDPNFVVITSLAERKYKLGENSLRGYIQNYQEFKTPDGRDTVTIAYLYFDRKYYVIE